MFIVEYVADLLSLAFIYKSKYLFEVQIFGGFFFQVINHCVLTCSAQVKLSVDRTFSA